MQENSSKVNPDILDRNSQIKKKTPSGNPMTQSVSVIRKLFSPSAQQIIDSAEFEAESYPLNRGQNSQSNSS